jgi:iron complex outermembrane recepter protein
MITVRHPRSFARTPLSLALLVSWAVSPYALYAAESSNETLSTAPIAVTGNPLGVGSDDLVTPVSVLNGHDLSIQRESTLGELLKSIPGVSASYYGPAASRPIIRGLDGDRIRMMQNGVGILDASALSPDHAVALDPLVIEQVDVVRGPAALLYGGSAVGGVVNAIDHRIPKESLDGVTGRYEARYGGADNQKNGAAVVDAGNGVFALHADAYGRKSDDLSIPDYATIPSRRAASDVKGRLVNSSSEGNGGAVGASVTLDNGYAGVSYSNFYNNYGSVAEQAVRIKQDSDRFDFASEFKDLGPVIERVKFRTAYTDYQHQEIEDGVVGTTFKNKGWEGTLEAGHAKLGRMSGVLGYQFQFTNFEALGDEAFVPKSKTNSNSVYVYEELPFDLLKANDFKVTFGGRVDQVNQSSEGGGKFGAAVERDFSPKSLATGALYNLTENWSWANNLSHNERAPTYNELFANGPHIATGQFEIGSSSLGKENSNGIDSQLRWKSGTDSASIGAYYTRFNNFITFFNTGVLVDADGNAGGDLNQSIVSGVPAEFKGLEGQAKFRIYDAVGKLNLNLRGDYVHATDLQNNQALPRISPMHLGFGLDYEFNKLTSRLDVLHGFKQDRLAANETETDAYTLVNLTATYKLSSQYHLEAFAKANNLLDQTIREHSSFLKDIAPLAGRALLVGIHGEF